MGAGRDGSIGVFDSGVGGLTVAGRIIECLPNESILYLGDTARVPYGTKSPATVIRYARACADILLQRGIKLLVVACNTASAYALRTLQSELDVPVMGVVEPGARAAARATRNQRIGLIGTAGTVASGEYLRAIRTAAPEAQVYCKACPLFVPLAEEGWTRGPVPAMVAREYLEELMGHAIDTLIMGCTHYPLLRETIAQTVGDSVTLVDSAEAAAEAVAQVLEASDLANPSGARPHHQFLVSDAPEPFTVIGERFLGREVRDVQWVDF